MSELKKYQKEFLLNTFFKNEDFPGWKNIATKLLENGSCIVAGNDCIWKGGISYYIKTNQTDNFIDCLEYVFDFETFKQSDLYKEQVYMKLQDLKDELFTIQCEIIDIENL